MTNAKPEQDREVKKRGKLPASTSEVEVRIQPLAPNNKLVKPSATPPPQTPADNPLEAFAKTATHVGEVISNTVAQTSKVVVETAVGVGEAVSSTAVQTGKAMVETAAGVGGAVGNTALQAGKAVVETATGVGEATAKQTYQIIEKATQGAGQAVNVVSDNWLVRRVTGALKLDWLIGATNQVDLQKAEAAVRKLQQKYPNETPSQIAHRLMVEKAAYAGGIGFVSSILPGAAAALLALDLAATMQLQAEMIYQIAAAYGLNLQDPARKGETMAIFGLGLGGSRVVKVGLGLLRNVPFAGVVVGASTNATMIYALGYAACRFYETKLDPVMSLTSEETIAKLTQQSEKYLEVAMAQEAVMDQILVHMVVASYPEKSWEEILPNIQALNLSPSSLEIVAANMKSPQPLDILLNQLNHDFAVPLLAQCNRIAEVNGVTTSEEARVIEAIATKFDEGEGRRGKG